VHALEPPCVVVGLVGGYTRHDQTVAKDLRFRSQSGGEAAAALAAGRAGASSHIVCSTHKAKARADDIRRDKAAASHEAPT